MKKILFLLVLIYNYGFSYTSSEMLTYLSNYQCTTTATTSTGSGGSKCSGTSSYGDFGDAGETGAIYHSSYSANYWYKADGTPVEYCVSTSTRVGFSNCTPINAPKNPCDGKSTKLISNILFSCTADSLTPIPNPDPNGGGQCRPLFALNGAAWTCDPNTNSATMVNDSNGVTLDENGNDVPSCNAGLVQKGNTCVSPEAVDSCPNGSHSFTDVITGQKGCIPDYIPPTTDSGTGTSSGGGSGSGSSSGGSGSSTGGTGTTDSGSGTGSGTSTGGTGTTDSGSGTGSGGSTGGSGTSGGGTGTPTDSGTGTPTDSGTGTPTDTPTTPTNTDGNGSCSATGLTLQEKMLCELNQNQDTTNSKLGVANTKLTNIDENMTKLAAQSAELNKSLNDSSFSSTTGKDSLTSMGNDSDSILAGAQQAYGNLTSTFDSIKGNYQNLKDFIDGKKSENATIDMINSSKPSCVNYNIFGKTKCYDCFFNEDLETLFSGIRPFITFLLNIYFMYLSISLFMKYALANRGGIV